LRFAGNEDQQRGPVFRLYFKDAGGALTECFVNLGLGQAEAFEIGFGFFVADAAACPKLGGLC